MLRRGRTGLIALIVALAVVGVALGALLASVTATDDDAAEPGQGRQAAAVAGDGDAADDDAADAGQGDAAVGGGNEPGGQSGGAQDDAATGDSATGDDGGSGGGSESPDDEQVSESGPVGEDRPREPLPGEKGFRLPGLDRTGDDAATLELGEAPRDASAVGSLVAGYPVDRLPVPDAADVLSSEVSSEGTRVRLSVQADCSCSANRVIAFHDRLLGRFGLIGAAQPAVGGSVSRGYGDGRSFLTLTVEPTEDGARFSLVSVLRVARA